MSDLPALGSFIRWRLGFAAVLLLGAMASGCSRVPRRFALEGQVTVDGAPLEAGAMAWIPMAGTVGPTCGGSIARGRFAIPASEGAREGEYRVEITASRQSERADSPSLDGMTMGYSVIQYLPARYNSESELVATVTRGGKNRYTFDLTTEKGKGASHQK
jgi:hypothetical protein